MVALIDSTIWLDAAGVGLLRERRPRHPSGATLTTSTAIRAKIGQLGDDRLRARGAIGAVVPENGPRQLRPARDQDRAWGMVGNLGADRSEQHRSDFPMAPTAHHDHVGAPVGCFLDDRAGSALANDVTVHSEARRRDQSAGFLDDASAVAGQLRPPACCDVRRARPVTGVRR